MQSVVDRKVVMRRMTVFCSIDYFTRHPLAYYRPYKTAESEVKL